MPGELDKAANQTRALREWFRSFVREHMGRPLTHKAFHELGPLNSLLERDEAFSQISRYRHRYGDGLELSDEALAIPRIFTAADWRSFGEVCM